MRGRFLWERPFLRTVTMLTLSLALQNLLTYSINLADNLMLGAYSETALSGSALCNQIQFLLQMLVSGVGEGVVVIGAQYWGRGDLRPIPDIIGVALRFAVAVSGGLFLIVLCFPAGVLSLLTSDAAVIAEGVKYLRIICFTYVIFAVTNMLVASLRSIAIVRLGYIISASTLCINICLNYCLIYGYFGFPRMGIEGAAIATLVSRCVELGIVVWFLKFRETKLRLTLRRLIRIDRSFLRDYVKVSLPVLLSQAQWGLAQMVQTGILGHLGAAAIAANSIATIVFQIISVVAYGAAGATGILTGRAVGEGDMARLHRMVNTFQVLFLGIGIVTGTLIFLARAPILRLYNISPESHALAMQFMAVLAVTSVGTSYQMACDTGVIRGGGDTKFSMYMNFVSMWFMLVPAAALCAFVFRFPPVVVFACLKSDQIYKAVPVVIRLWSYRWVKKVTRGAEESV